MRIHGVVEALIDKQTCRVQKAQRKNEQDQKEFIAWLKLPLGTPVEFCCVFGVWSYGKVTGLARFSGVGLTIEVDGECLYSEKLWFFPQRDTGHRYLNLTEWRAATGLDCKRRYEAYVDNARAYPLNIVGKSYEPKVD